MLPDIYVFDKSTADRSEEYFQTFEDNDTLCYDIEKAWSYELEFSMEISGWQALWVLSQKNCKKFNLLHPTSVIVQVNDVDFTKLTSSVEITALQEDISLPSELIDVPIIELYPTKYQPEQSLDIYSTAYSLDKCRYFYKNLWYPWDAKKSITLKIWCRHYLMDRLQLQEALKSGAVDACTKYYITNLINEAWDIYHEIDELPSEDLEEDQKIKLINLHRQYKQVKIELKLFEIAEFRNSMISKYKEQLHCSTSIHIKFVWIEGSLSELMEYTNIIKQFEGNIDETKLRIYNSLQSCLSASSPGDSIYLSPGIHSVYSLNSLELGGQIKGLTSYEHTKLIPDTKCNKAVLLEFFGPSTMENILISRFEGTIMQVNNGTALLKNCKISSEDCLARGIVVRSGCCLEIEKCDISGLLLGIMLLPGSSLKLEETQIRFCSTGLQISEGCTITMKQVRFVSNRVYSIMAKTCNPKFEVASRGSEELLTQDNINGLNITLNDVVFSESGKSNVAIKKLNENIFQDPESDDFEVYTESSITVSDGDS